MCVGQVSEELDRKEEKVQNGKEGFRDLRPAERETPQSYTDQPLENSSRQTRNERNQREVGPPDKRSR